ncbi:hypothetical protein BDN70DRAFT_801301, partial [Pholiota conissans]
SIHNFSFPSATVENDLSRQLSHFFVRFPKKSQANPAPALDPTKTIYVLFLGINDCGGTRSDELEPIAEILFDAVHDLYVKAGARIFVVVDVPPINRSPSAVDASDEVQNRVETWNGLLQTHVKEFATGSTQATVFLFSSHKVLTEVLDDPLEYEFTEDDAADEGGAIWEDDLRITPAVHAILAERFIASLKEQHT